MCGGWPKNGLTAAGWDPYYAPDNPIHSAGIVNLGFVINAIEDSDERLEALTRAGSLAERLLVVSVMLANQNDPRGEWFRDGVMTQRGSFQKYYIQAEIEAFLGQVLDEVAIPVAPGVLYVHIVSGKVSQVRYDDFEGQPLPRMVERIKIKLRAHRPEA